ncbi:ATP-binding protein [Geodermatophilus sp. SYSU D00779]
MTELDKVAVTSKVTLPPNSRLLSSLGRNHDLASAIADLVDNSIDAGAQHVRIRFIRRNDRLIRLYVLDDGRGIAERQINNAMTIGGQRDYRADDLGHFGLGLKAASFGHADQLTLLSKTDDGEQAGRHWALDGALSGFACDVVDPKFVKKEMRAQPLVNKSRSGTIVRWDAIRTFPLVSDERETNRFLTDTIAKLQRHLGLVFHRLLQEGRIDVSVDEYDLDSRAAGSPIPISAIDPFAYSSSGHPEYPKNLTVRSDPQHTLVCHLWPPRSTLREFRLDERPDRYQGLYVYRNDRLIQAGGWNGVVHTDRELQLARVVLDLAPGSEVNVRLNPEKSRVEPTEGFVRALQRAAGDEVSLDDYLEDARALYRRGRRRQRKRPRVIPAGRGLAPEVKSALRTELLPIPNEEPIDIRWGRIPGDVFFQVDRDARVLLLNRKYRSSFVGSTGGSLNDAPLLKTCLYLLIEDVFQGHYMGSRDKDNIEMWQAVLTAAAKAQQT